MLTVRKINLPAWQQGNKCPYTLTPNGIVVHNTANDASAINEISYMQRNTSPVSFHFAVDDKEAVQGIELNRNTWHAGDGTGYRSANRTKLSVEICYSRSGGTRFTKAERNAAKLIAILCLQYGWSTKNISKHNDYRTTACPHRTLQLGWRRFLNMVQEEINILSGNPSKQPSNAYIIRVTTAALNIRRGAGTNYPVEGVIRDKGLYTIMEEKTGFGRLKGGAGWISLAYTKKQ